MKSVVRIGCVALGALTAACTSVPMGAGFDDVEREVSDRIGARAHWHRGGAGDGETRAAITALLSSDLSSDGAVQVALLSNPTLQATYESLGIAQADLVQAGLLSNPVLSASAAFPVAGGTTVVDLELVQNFLNILLRPARQQLAQEDFERTRLDVAAQVLDHAWRVRRAFYELQAVQQQAAILQSAAEAARASNDLAVRFHQAGNISDLERVVRQAQFEDARIAAAQSETAVFEARERLSVLMGLWGERLNWSIADALPDIPETEIDLDQLESLAVARRLDLAAARKDIEIAASTLGLTEQWRYVADLNLGVAANREDDGEWFVGPGVSLDLPIFDQRQAAIAKDNAQLRRAQRQYEALAIEIRSEIRAARARLVAARRLAMHLRTVVMPLQRQIVDLTLQEHNFALVGAFDLLLAKQNEIMAGIDYVETLRDYWLARADLERAVGGRIATAPAGQAIAPEPVRIAHHGKER